MATTLVYGAITITLNDDLSWTDEYGWKPVEQKKTYSIGGRLLVESTAKSGGRPMTLQASESSAWMSRATVDALMTAAAIAGQQFTLTLRSTAYAVAFDHEQGAVQATPVVDYSDPNSTDYYVLTLRFYIVS